MPNTSTLQKVMNIIKKDDIALTASKIRDLTNISFYSIKETISLLDNMGLIEIHKRGSRRYIKWKK